MSSPATAKLQVIVRKLNRLGTPAFKGEVVNACRQVAQARVADEFARSVDPTGKRWRPLAWRKGQILVKTGTLRSSFVTAPTPDGFSMWSQVQYFRYHQFGTGTIHTADLGHVVLQGRSKGGIPARPMLPTGELPKSWAAEFNHAAAEVMDAAMGKAA